MKKDDDSWNSRFCLCLIKIKGSVKKYTYHSFNSKYGSGNLWNSVFYIEGIRQENVVDALAT